MPIGTTLTGEIAKLLSLDVDFGDRVNKGDHKIFFALKQLVTEHSWGENSFIQSSRAVAEAMQLALSIDTFLESHFENREFVQLGKLGIARAISLAEAQSKMKPGKENNAPFRMTALSDTWYYSLARQLFTGVPAHRPELAFENVTFVVFNYDRCLQIFLMHAAAMYFRITLPQATQLMQNVRFIHPYGTIGSVFEGSPDYVPFASDQFDLNTVASRIRTFSESSDLAFDIRREVCRAETIIFLGFGFHGQNMALLDVGKDYGIEEPPPKRVFVTTKGLSTSDEGVVRGQISHVLWATPQPLNDMSSISTNNGTCAELFSAYWRSLTN
ncbi:hypothetical protein DFR51_1658 [Sphingosinicella microcystinivorans]|nr:hypothetical protein DFR51_1658 [Sphingosinicella microcystinivorans]